ncbi:acylphosphatase [Candidatus Acetothermia bacterium]|nr:acylphosphatase [Candidatus Acetothermia bacterium]MBI3660795.1 acylphosphatase [Candidatus Acetothermia bacterium]
MAKVRAVVRVLGTVQGVGFRNFAVWKARPLRLTGYVQNLSDGTVRLEIEGNHPTIEKFLEQLKQGPEESEVEELEVIWTDYLDEFSDFTVWR